MGRSPTAQPGALLSLRVSAGRPRLGETARLLLLKHPWSSWGALTLAGVKVDARDLWEAGMEVEARTGWGTAAGGGFWKKSQQDWMRV